MAYQTGATRQIRSFASRSETPARPALTRATMSAAAAGPNSPSRPNKSEIFTSAASGQVRP